MGIVPSDREQGCLEVFKGYLRYKTLTFQNVSSEAPD